MNDTVVTIVGNALNTPEWRRLEHSQVLVAKFKVASTSRRFDKEHGRWVDGSSLRVRVNCWRHLAENVAASVLSGDPVIVTGRMYTRDWIGEGGQRRVSFELDAVAVGHDLSRGRSQFVRNQRALGTTAVEDDQAERRVRGEATDRVGERHRPGRRSGTADQASPDAAAGAATKSSPVSVEALEILQAAGLAGKPFDQGEGPQTGAEPDESRSTTPADPWPPLPGGSELVGAQSGGAEVS
ncbi:MAG: single-stranded DNA-binding protein [Dactylosporangium sp.]|nr:single-stranded DNA-binding protein [Dactylosporangium sp.]NNJ63152.1 single-stranded DNA-binding protein [Dactylosporangium sp.]